MQKKSLLFEWDQEKEAANWVKHKISFEEAASVFLDSEYALRIKDWKHSNKEDRFLIIGESQESRILFVVYTTRSNDSIRIISARKANKKERTIYAENSRIRFQPSSSLN